MSKTGRLSISSLPFPKALTGPALLAKDGDELEIHYRHLLETLGREKGMLGSPLVNLEYPPEGSKIRLTVRREMNHGKR